MLAVAAAFAVVGEIIAELVSSTQIDSWDLCERKWGWRYIAKLREPQGAAAALGTECDDTQLQPYLRDGRDIDYRRRSGNIVQPGLIFLPAPKAPGIEVQRHFVMPGGQRPVFSSVRREVVGHTKPRFGLQGFIDLWAPNGIVMPDAAYDPKQGSRVFNDGYTPPVVGDFKTTGNWKYQKTAEDLAVDTQAQLYAAWALRETDAPVVDLIWIYFGTKGAHKAKRTHLRVYRDQVALQLERINTSAIAIYGHRKAQTDPLQLTPNPAACGKFGGCPYESKCNLSPGQKTDAAAAQHARRNGITMTTTAELLANLKAKQAASPGAAAVMTAPPSLEEHVAANPRAAFLMQPTTPAGIPIANLPSHATQPLGINPPESQLPPAPPVGSVTIIKVDGNTGGVEAEKPKKGPGRPRKDPTGADAMMHTGAAPSVGEIKGLIDDLKSIDTGNGRSVRAVWAQETYCPVAFNPFVVGPFEATGPVLSGETYADAHARIYAELVTFAENARAEKAVSFQKTLAAFGGGR